MNQMETMISVSSLEKSFKGLNISLTGQYAAVDQALTGRENLQMIASLRHIPHGDKKAEELLSEFNLIDVVPGVYQLTPEVCAAGWIWQ